MTDQIAPLTAEQQAQVLNNLLTDCAILRKWIDSDTAFMNALIAKTKDSDPYIEAEVARANNAKLLQVKEDEARTAALSLYALTKTKKQPGVTVKTMTTDPRPVYDGVAIFQWAINAKPGLLALDVPKFEEYAEAVKTVDPVPGVAWTVATSTDKAQLDKDLSKFLPKE